MNDREARRRFAAARVARLATVAPDGAPHVVPIVFALEQDVIYSAVDRKPKRSSRLARLSNLRVEPRVTVLVDSYDERWDRLWWVRADGRGEVAVDGPLRERAVAALRAKYPQYGDEPPEGAAIVIRVERWRSWSAEDR